MFKRFPKLIDSALQPITWTCDQDAIAGGRLVPGGYTTYTGKYDVTQDNLDDGQVREKL